MAVQQSLDITAQINATGRAQLDVGGYDYAEVQLVSPNTTANFTGTNDAGDVTGVSDGNATSATNWVTLSGIKMSDASAVTSLASSDIVKFQNLPRFIRVMGAGLTVTKAIVRLYKIN